MPDTLYPDVLGASSTLYAPTVNYQALEASINWVATSDMVVNGDSEEAYPLAMEAESEMLIRLSLPPTSTPADGSTLYRVEVCYIDADASPWLVPLGDLENAKITSPITTELNRTGSLDFTLPVNDDKAYLIQSPDREVRVWRNGQLFWWGVIVRVMADSKELKVSCMTLDWYFTKRVFGRANRTNLISNNSFENGVGSWSGPSHWPGSYPYQRFGSYEIVQDTVVEGQRALAMDQRLGTVGGLSNGGYFIAQSTLWTVDPDLVEDETRGEEWTATCWMYVKRSEFEPEIFNNSDNKGGIRLVRYSTTKFYLLFHPDSGTYNWEPEPLGTSWIPFDGETFDKWIRAETPILQPVKAGEAEQISVFLETPYGAKIRFDNVSLTRVESSIWKGTEQATIFTGIVNHAQDTEYGKSNLHITPSAPTTGIKRTRVYKHQDHQIIADALNEFPTLHQGMDWAVTFTNTSRTAQAYYPRKGYRKPWCEVSVGGNLVAFGVAIDGQRVATSVIVQGEGEGSDLEEGGAVDASGMNGLVLEKVFHATPGSAVSSLGEQALRAVNRFKNRVAIPEVVIRNDTTDFVTDLEVGDIIPVNIQHGWIDVAGDYRIIQIKHDTESELTTLVLNPMTEEFL